MIYSKHIITPLNPVENVIVKNSLRITKGLVFKVEIYFPCGSAGLLGVSIFDSAFSIWPSNIGEFFTGDDILISFDDLYLKEQPPFKFDIYTYNNDTANDHVLDVRIGLVSKEAYQARFLPNKSWDYFARMLREIEQEQAEQAAIQRAKIIETPFDWLKE